jgi:hypothetical protein
MPASDASPGTQDAPQALTEAKAAEQMIGLLSLAEDPQPDAPEPPADEAPEAPADSAEDAEEAPEGDDANDPPPESDEEPAPQPKQFKVVVDGEELTVTEEELLKGYSRTADYTRKTQQLAAARKELEEVERPKLQATLAAYEQNLERLQSALRGIDEPDWDRLRAERPTEFPILWAEHQRLKEQQAAVAAEQTRVAEMRQAEQDREVRKYLEAERQRVFEVIPEWKDEKVVQEEVAALRSYGQSLGFSDAELANLVDHRAIVLMRKAMLFDRQTTQQKQVISEKRVKATPKTVPTAAPRTPADKAMREARQRLKATGRDEHAVALMEQYFR